MNLTHVGVSVCGLPDGTALLVTPTGEQFRVGAPADELAALLARCDGSATIEELATGSDEPDAVRALLEVLLDAGCLTTAQPHADARWWARFTTPPANPDRVSTASIVLFGDPEVVGPLHSAMIAAGIAAPQWLDPDRLAERLARPVALVVCALAAPDHTLLLAVQDACATAGTPWAAFVLDQGTGWLGPLVVPGHTADYRDLIDRRRCLVDDPELWPAYTTPPVWPDPPVLPPAAELTWMVSAMAIELSRWLAGAPCRLLSTETQADPVSLTLTDHPILPVPLAGRVTHPVLSSWDPTPDHLVDNRTGIVIRLRDTDHHPAVPSALRSVQADVSNMARAHRQPWQNDLISGGTSFADREAARKAALGEAVERYCANWTGGVPMVRASYDELAASGEHAVDPETLVLYSPRQYAQEGFPFVPFTRDLEVRWVKGRCITRDTDAWLPASLVYINWHMADTGEEPVLGFHNYAGVAAGPTVEFALTSAIEEVVERDAMMTWWSNRHALPAVRLTDDLAMLWEGEPTKLGQHAWAIHLDNQSDIPVIAGIVENTTEQFLTIGFAARPDPRDATRKAWAEALSLQEGSRDLLLPEGESTVRTLLSLQGGDGDYLKPWRADRAYMDSYRDDLHDVVQLLCQEQFHLDPRARKRVAPWVDVAATRAYDDLPHLPDRTLPTYRDRVERHGYEIFAAELTTPDIALCGLYVVRVLIPGLAPNFPAAFPTWGRGRIQNHAVHLGWRTDPLPEEQLNTFPLPYA